MTAAANIFPLGLLQMKLFYFWLRSRGFNIQKCLLSVIRVMRCGLHTLGLWKRPQFPTLVPTLWVCYHCKTLSTGASLMGWSVFLNGHPSHRIWPSSFMPHNLPENNGCVSSFEALFPASEGLTCSLYVHVKNYAQVHMFSPSVLSMQGMIMCNVPFICGRPWF